MDVSTDFTLSAALVGGVAGGVGGSLLLVIIVLVVIVSVLVCQVQRSGHAKFNLSGKCKPFHLVGMFVRLKLLKYNY